MKSAKQSRSVKSRAAGRTARRENDEGAAAVELALVLPILLTLVFGIIYFGYIFAAQISLNSSARDAARAGVVKPLSSVSAAMTCAQIATMARAGGTTIGLDPNNILVTVKSVTSTTSCTLPKGSTVVSPNASAYLCAGTTGQLEVKLSYTAVSPVPLVPISSVDLKSTGAFQCEYS